MKIETKEVVPQFKPVVLTLETPNEVALFCAFVGAIAPSFAETHFAVPVKNAAGRCWSHEAHEQLTKALRGHIVPNPLLTVNCR